MCLEADSQHSGHNDIRPPLEARSLGGDDMLFGVPPDLGIREAFRSRDRCFPIVRGFECQPLRTGFEVLAGKDESGKRFTANDWVHEPLTAGFVQSLQARIDEGWHSLSDLLNPVRGPRTEQASICRTTALIDAHAERLSWPDVPMKS